MWGFKSASKLNDYYLALKFSFPLFPNCCLNIHPSLFRNWMIMRGSNGLVLRISNAVRLWSLLHGRHPPHNHSESSLSLYLQILKDLFLEAILCSIQKPDLHVSSLQGLWSSVSVSGLALPRCLPEKTWIGGLAVLKNIPVVCDFLSLGVAEFAGPNLLELVGSRETAPTQGADHQVNLGLQRKVTALTPKPWQLALTA